MPASAVPSMTQDPRELLAHSPMTRMQVLVVAITVALTALDGFDVLAISFAAPGIARDWGIDRAALGIVLSMELIGMGIGSILVGGLADRLGRRYTMLGCVTAMALGMAMAATARGVYDLSIWRVFTGLGIGGILAASNAVAAEFSSLRRRDLSVSLMAIGYPLGAIGGGSVVAVLLRHGTWREVFVFGAAMTALFIPVVFCWVPESIAWLCYRQPARALERVNRGLLRLGRPPVAALPPLAPRPARNVARVGIFRPALATTTVLLSLTYFTHITTFYFILKWVPKIVVDMGFAPSAAAGVLVWANVGGATGGMVLGLLTQRFAVKHLTLVVLVLSTVMVVAFGHGQPDLTRLSLVCAATGFCTNAGVVGIYAVLARAFPADVRATGSGFVLGTGRGGAVLAPIVAGVLFQAGFGLQAVAICMGAGSLVAAACLAMIRVGGRDAPAAI
jgi:benzoate transport